MQTNLHRHTASEVLNEDTVVLRHPVVRHVHLWSPHASHMLRNNPRTVASNEGAEASLNNLRLRGRDPGLEYGGATEEYAPPPRDLPQDPLNGLAH